MAPAATSPTPTEQAPAAVSPAASSFKVSLITDASPVALVLAMLLVRGWQQRQAAAKPRAA